MKYIACLAILSLSGCGTYYYYPTYQHVPAHSKAKEIRANYFGSADNEGVSVSYAFTEKLGAFSNFNTFDNYQLAKGAYLFDVGGFYLHNIKVGKNRLSNLSLSLSSAYGRGEYNRDREFYHLSLSRIYLQPSFAFTSPFVDVGISSRFSGLAYNLDEVNGQKRHEALHQIEKNAFLFYEPQAMIGVGYKWIKLNYHLTKSVKINKEEISFFDDEVGYFSLSIKYDTEKLFD